MAPVLVIKGKCLYDLVNEAFIDDYPREDKTSRDNPRKKMEKPPGKPTICNATKTTTETLKALTKRSVIRVHGVEWRLQTRSFVCATRPEECVHAWLGRAASRSQGGKSAV